MTDTSKYRIILKSVIYGSCYLIPNFGSSDENSVCYVLPREYSTSLDPTIDRY